MKTVQVKYPHFLPLYLASLFFIAFKIQFASASSDPELRIKSPKGIITFKRSELLERPEIKRLEVEDPAYSGKKMSYSGIAIYLLFQNIDIPDNATIQFQCTDGFSAPIDRERLLNHSDSGSIAYLAIEKPEEHWPPLNPPTNLKSPGPFYLVWTNPQASKISREEWPFQLAGFEVRESIKAAYPALLPDSRLTKTHPIQRGFHLFTKNCFPCHSLNLQGEGTIGPDLNIPMNPTEYLGSKNLKILIRDPQKLRVWKNSKMKGFSEAELSNQEVDDIILYLKHMAKRKFPSKAPEVEATP